MRVELAIMTHIPGNDINLSEYHQKQTAQALIKLNYEYCVVMDAKYEVRLYTFVNFVCVDSRNF